MAINLPNYETKKGHPSAPKARVPGVRKPAHLRPFSAYDPQQCCLGHCKGPPRPSFAEQGPFPPPPGSEFSPFHSGASRIRLGQPLGIVEVAELIGCSPWTVRQTLIPRGLPHFRFTASGRLIFYRDQVIRWIENQQQGGQTTK